MKRATPYLLLLPLTLYFLTFLVTPILIVARYSLATRGPLGGVQFEWTLANYAATLDPRYLDILARSLGYAGAATLICLLLAYPMAYWIAMQGGQRKGLLLLCLMLPFWTSFLVRIYAWKAILGAKGLLNLGLISCGLISQPLQLLNSPFAVILGLVYGFLPFMALPIYVSLEKLDRTLMDAASDLGATPRTTFFKVVLPLSMPGVIAGCILTFIPAIGDFVTPDLLGGPENKMIGNVIESKFFPEQDWPMGSAVACGLMALLLVSLIAYTRRVVPEES
ncbi:MAG: ABC transporter permease [Armatimonadetes bacterium]|nr:ABC transporter permease [Armatimonadota bacterium]